MLIKDQRARLQLQAWRFAAIERAYDLAAIFWPIFLTAGLLVGCFRFWLWLFGVM